MTELHIVDKTVAPMELVQVEEDLRRKGVSHASIYKGNGCIWVHYGLINSYYIFKDSQLVDIVYD
jgi:hypothetical protein